MTGLRRRNNIALNATFVREAIDRLAIAKEFLLLVDGMSTACITLHFVEVARVHCLALAEDLEREERAGARP